MEAENLNEPKNPALQQGAVTSSADLEDDFYDDEYYENQPHEDCPKCGRHYDDIDFDYQICSHCKYNAESKTFLKIKPI